MSRQADESPAGKVMDEAIELAIEGRSPCPDQSAFIDADTPHTEDEIRRAVANGRAAVLCFADGTTRVLRPEAAAASGR